MKESELWLQKILYAMKESELWLQKNLYAMKESVMVAKNFICYERIRVMVAKNNQIINTEKTCSWIRASWYNSYRKIQQDTTMYQNLLFHIYMFRATRCPSSGA